MKDLLFIDFETSGIDSEIHIPLQLGAILVDGEKLEIKETFKEFILPPTDQTYICTEGAYRINGIDPNRMPENSLTQYTLLDKFFRSFPAGGYIVAAWNVGFDISFLKKMCMKFDKFRSIYGCLDYHHMDVQSICIYLRSKEVISSDCVSFNDVLKFFNLDTRSEKHDGLEDAYLTYKLFTHLNNYFYIR